MTVYEINYRNRLAEMKNAIVQKYGYEHNRTAAFLHEIEKRADHPCYQNRELLERLFKGWMK
jgi:hypothetical protein